MVTASLLNPQVEIVRSDWKGIWAVEAFEKLANPGIKPFKGPMLILQGTDDPVVQYDTTESTVDKTCKRYANDLELLIIPERNHFGTINAGRHRWLQWIQDRFENQPMERSGCVQTQVDSFLSRGYYQKTPNSFSLWAGKP